MQVHFNRYLGKFKIPIFMMFRWTRGGISSFDFLFKYIRYELCTECYAMLFCVMLSSLIDVYAGKVTEVSRISNQTHVFMSKTYGVFTARLFIRPMHTRFLIPAKLLGKVDILFSICLQCTS